MDPSDLVENSLKQIIQEELNKQKGPVKMDAKTIKTIAKVKFDRYEQRRLYKA